MVDATLLALAGLLRLGMHDVISASQVIAWDEMLPAVAQGAIGIQCRSDDSAALQYLAALNHVDTKLAVECERRFLAALDGNCRTPIAGQATIANGKMSFRGLMSKPDGTAMVKIEKQGVVRSEAEAGALGYAAGLEIRNALGDKFSEYQHAVAASQ